MAHLIYTEVQMRTNAKMTHYRKVPDKVNRISKWERTVYQDVLWQGGKGARLNKGFIESNDVKVRIPYATNIIGEFTVGDIIVKGVHDDIEQQTDLKDSYNITSAVDNGFGNLKHVHLEGQ